MGTIVDLPVITTLSSDPDRVLEKAIGQLKRVVVLGVEHDGTEYFASSDPDGGSILWDMERARFKLMKIAEGEDG